MADESRSALASFQQCHTLSNHLVSHLLRRARPEALREMSQALSGPDVAHGQRQGFGLCDEHHSIRAAGHARVEQIML